MKYLKLYEEENKGITLQYYLNSLSNNYFIDNILWDDDTLHCDYQDIFSLKTKDYDFSKVKHLNCTSNKIENLDGIENFTNLENLHCEKNNLESLKGIENCKKLERLDCQYNNLKNLDGIENLPNLKYVYCQYNKWEFPLSLETFKKFFYGPDDVYTEYNIIHFRTYNCQKAFLDKYPERVGELKEFGYNIELLNDPEYAWLFDQETNGFFGLK